MTGQMSGSMANFVTTTRGNQNIIRSKAFQPKDANTVAQQKQRGGMKMLSGMYNWFGGIIEEGYPEYEENKSAYLLYIGSNLTNGVIDKSGPEPALNYSKLLIANGSLPTVVATGTITEEGIAIAYKTNVGVPRVKADDEVVAVARLLSGELLLARQVRGANATEIIMLPYEGIRADDVEFCYLFVRNADGSKASRSVYIPLA